MMCSLMVSCYNRGLKLLCSIRQQSDVTSTLDSLGQLTLMQGTGTSHTTRQDLATLGHVSLQLCYVLIINSLNLIYTERTNLSAATAAAIGAIFSFSSAIVITSLFDNQNGTSPSSSEISAKSELPAGISKLGAGADCCGAAYGFGF